MTSPETPDDRRPHLRRTAFGAVELFPDLRRPHGWRLFLDGVLQSYVDTADPGYLDYECLRWMARLADAAAPASALHLGAGAMALPRYLASARPGIRQEVVDVDAGLLELVAAVLPPPGPGVRVRVADGVDALVHTDEASVDLVAVDAFLRDRTPAHLTGARVARLARRALTPAGMVMMNVADEGDLEWSQRRLADLAAAFEHAYLIASPAVLRGGGRGNVVLAARRDPLDESALTEALAAGRTGGERPELLFARPHAPR